MWHEILYLLGVCEERDEGKLVLPVSLSVSFGRNEHSQTFRYHLKSFIKLDYNKHRNNNNKYQMNVYNIHIRTRLDAILSQCRKIGYTTPRYEMRLVEMTKVIE